MFTEQLLHQRYRLLHLLGSGGMSQAFLAEDLQNPANPRCVIKKLHPFTQDPQQLFTARMLFQREAEVLEKLGENEQIPQLLAYFEAEGDFYLVEEFIEGHSLGMEIQPGQRWTETQVIRMLLEVLPILEFIHNNNVIHRDIKPDNIIRRDRDQKCVLIDFGAVRQINGNPTLSSMGRAGTIVGTLGYMPTEQGHGNPRPNSDLYALGIVCIQALTGLLPSQLQLDNQTGELQWQRYVNVNADLATVLTKMVRYHFKDRYQTATETLRAVKTLRRKLDAMPVVPVTKTQNWRRPLLLAGLGVAATGLAFWGWQSWTTAQVSLGGDRTLDIGVLTTGQGNPKTSYETLTSYIEEQVHKQFGNGFSVKLHTIDMNEPNGLERANQAVKTQEWDLAFTTVSLLSATAVKNNYQFAARMFPGRPQNEAVLFVRQDSPIASIKDLNANTTLALGEFNNGAGFYMPVYDLYGKTLRLNLGNTVRQSMAKVRSAQADVGAGVAVVVKKNPDLRIIHTSRGIPMSGVYLSPKLNAQEQKQVTKLLLNAPADLQEKAQYGAGQPVDYSQFLQVVKRVDEVTRCTNWQQNPVNLFCASVVGTTSGYSTYDDAVHFSLQAADGKTYRLVLPSAILNRDPSLDSPGALNFKKVGIKNVQPVKVDGVEELRITEPGQLTLLS